MAQHYSPRHFFRQVPNRLLRQYFNERGVLEDVEFKQLKEAEVGPIFEAWDRLSEDDRDRMEADFRDVHALACPGGTLAILDEARWWNVPEDTELADRLSNMKNHHERAMWVFLERPDYWRGGLRFLHADNIATSFWRKRKNLPKVAAHVGDEDIDNLARNVGNYFHEMQGRGKNCKVEPYRRNNLDYFFAFPEDFAQASIEWKRGQFERLPRHPAFEVIFVYSKSEGTLDIYLKGDRGPIADLQGIFAQAILYEEKLPTDKADERVYELDPLLDRNYEFVIPPDSTIEKVFIKGLRLSLLDGRNQKLVVESEPGPNGKALFDLLERVTSKLPKRGFHVTQARIQAVFQPAPERRGRTRTFTISYPNSCSLRWEERDLEIRRMLAESGLEPVDSTGPKAASGDD